MSKVCMAAVNENDKTFTIGRLQERFPEIPEAVISKILTQHAYNMEKCITILSQESDRYLYGDESNSHVSPFPLSAIEPLSIQIPNNPPSDLSANFYRGIDSPRLSSERYTVGLPSSSSATSVSGAQGDRHHNVDEYSRQLRQHQQQRLERLIKEVETEKHKAFELQSLVITKKEELLNKKFRVASNPSKTDVDHLEEETQVLREEIDQMSHEIDRIKSLPPPVKKSQSFPRPHPPHYINNLPRPINGPRPFDPRPPWLTSQSPRPVGPRPPWLPTQRSQSPVRDPGNLEEQGWIFLPPDHQLPPVSTASPTEPPNRASDDTEVNWVCKHCTLENHGALNTCEACERPRI